MFICLQKKRIPESYGRLWDAPLSYYTFRPAVLSAELAYLAELRFVDYFYASAVDHNQVLVHKP